MTNIIMNGCNGRMGRMITDIANKDTDVQIVAGIDAYDKVANDYPVFTNIFDCNVDADVIIDFSGGLFGCFIDWLLCRFKNKKKNKNSSSGIVAK